jgi:hypothetical protein
MISDGQRRHVEVNGALDELLDACSAIEHGVFGVRVEVDEGHGAPPLLAGGVGLEPAHHRAVAVGTVVQCLAHTADGGR